MKRAVADDQTATAPPGNGLGSRLREGTIDDNGSAPTGSASTRSDPILLEKLAAFGTAPLSFLLRYQAPWQTFSLAQRNRLLPRVATRGGRLDRPSLPASKSFLRCSKASREKMRAEHRSVCLVAVSEQTARVAIEVGFSALKIGEEPWFDLGGWHPPRGDRGKKFRWAVNHARRLGVEVAEYRPGEGAISPSRPRYWTCSSAGEPR